MRKIERKARAFEKKHGSVAFTKACISVLNKLLVDRGYVQAKELETRLECELDGEPYDIEAMLR